MAALGVGAIWGGRGYTANNLDRATHPALNIDRYMLNTRKRLAAELHQMAELSYRGSICSSLEGQGHPHKFQQVIGRAGLLAFRNS